ncbi:hypothetical protein [Croceicoccus estronivorus]|nr:hypothetical protein [Croceicoccus estronivorus]
MIDRAPIDTLPQWNPEELKRIAAGLKVVRTPESFVSKVTRKASD